MLTQRDRRVLRFIDAFGCATTKQIQTLCFPSLRRCQQRLYTLTMYGKLKRARDYISAEYLYYADKKPKEIEHMRLRVDVYLQLIKDYELCTFQPEYTLGHLRADAYFEIYRNGYVLPFFLEIQRSPNFRQDKYEKVYNSGIWLDLWEEFPPVVVVSDHTIRYKPSSLKFIHINQNSPVRL